VAGDSGFAIALTALLIVPLLAFTAYAVDLGAWYARASQLQRAADAAALAGAPLLPDEARAAAAAVNSLTKNGFCTTATTATCTSASTNITITMGRVQSTTNQYTVGISDGKAQQFFSVLGRPPGAVNSCTPQTTTVCIQRSGTAEKIRPVPMGSPRNFLGTLSMMTKGLGGRGPYPGTNSGSDENFLLSASGYCARTEHGDRIDPRADANGSGTGSCTISGTSPRPNLFWRPAPNGTDSIGYYYGIDIPAGASGSYSLDVFDAADCQFETPASLGGGLGADSGADGSSTATSSPRKYHFDITTSKDPTSGVTPLSQTTVAPSDCATYANKWVPLPAFAGTGGFTYYLHVWPDTPSVKNIAEGQNQFALAVHQASQTFSPCTSDQTTSSSAATNPVAGLTYSATCPKIYALSDLGVYVATPPGNPSFYLASVGPEHSGKTMNVELFDFAEGSTNVQLLDPKGNPVTFTAEIACKDGTYESESGACTTGENAPTANSKNSPIASGGNAQYGPWTTNSLDVCGTNSGCTGTQPWSTGMTQNTLYSDRIVRLQYNLPNNYGSTFCPNPTTSPSTCYTWWKISLQSGGASGDRTTWTVNIKGDPVRLVSNPTS
jgi:hypothetical protein